MWPLIVESLKVFHGHHDLLVDLADVEQRHFRVGDLLPGLHFRGKYNVFKLDHINKISDLQLLVCFPSIGSFYRN